ncbi:type II toxin-antitoxin system RelB/DinJ family antitoxin [Lapidilactobacillus achengensis]|uniref:Type II toxin-antitoxin system RelB/DinJ family antitoxin n=1 Tax=Lapidilactobacillus achengensis TaxID=2486000 RepID=A0ABW1ULE4_9LACO|nr:type II toxin-antitoxin system RelB/DinJ family antitoxin [Lapidilactobacillus achengensis]
MASINVRIDEDTKKESQEILEALGMDLTTGIRVFLNQVIAEKGLPFAVKLSPLEASIMEMKMGQTKTVSSVKELMDDINND